jgi:hypothetical protein
MRAVALDSSGHLEACESMRNRQSRLNEIENTLRTHAPVVGDRYTSNVETDRLDTRFDLAATLIGGLTQVVTIASGVGCNRGIVAARAIISPLFSSFDRLCWGGRTESGSQPCKESRLVR